MTAHSPTGLRESWDALLSGTLSRREFVTRASALGVSGPVILAAVNAAGIHEAAAQESASERPSFNTADQRRGEGGELTVRQWLAPTNLFAHSAFDERYPMASIQVSSMIVEPLFSISPDGSLLPTLAAQVPTKANGGLSDDLSTITIDLREDILWSDGEPFTADDVVWTWEWITDPANATWVGGMWSAIQVAEATSPAQVRFIYANPTLGWFLPLAGGHFGGIIPKHVWSGKDLEAGNLEFSVNPIGTGPYKVDEFVADEYIVCSINELYRESNKPYFETVRFLGGGDAAIDAQEVLDGNDGDVAALLFIDPEVLLPMASSSTQGTLIAGVPTEVERITFNFSDPNREVDGERSSLQAEHPFLTDRRVREAMAMAIDRETIAREIFLNLDLHPPATNILTGISELESQNSTHQFDIDAANDLLDEAGWAREGAIRMKNGVKLTVSYFTAAGEDNALVKRFRPLVQAVVKEGWEAIGIEVQLGRLNGADFFNIDPANEGSYAHFYRDIEMFSSGPESPFPVGYFLDYYAGPGNSNVAQRSNDWTGVNIQRYVNPQFDKLYEEVTSTIDPKRAVELFIEMNDLIVGDFVVVPLVARPDLIYAIGNRIATDNIAVSKWEPLFWNIANWREVQI